MDLFLDFWLSVHDPCFTFWTMTLHCPVVYSIKVLLLQLPSHQYGWCHHFKLQQVALTPPAWEDMFLQLEPYLQLQINTYAIIVFHSHCLADSESKSLTGDTKKSLICTGYIYSWLTLESIQFKMLTNLQSRKHKNRTGCGNRHSQHTLWAKILQQCINPCIMLYWGLTNTSTSYVLTQQQKYQCNVFFKESLHNLSLIQVFIKHLHLAVTKHIIWNHPPTVYVFGMLYIIKFLLAGDVPVLLNWVKKLNAFSKTTSSIFIALTLNQAVK